MITMKRPSSYPVIHKNECKACERCIMDCPLKVLELSEDLNDNGYQYVKYTGENCNGCGNCYYACPEPLAIEVHSYKRKRK
ncbi:ferredoxin family protein [Methanobrevibacter sp. DSM 116169]|uniref:4Fe-4S dicluster domain-containing protein n=1 Tax=Methanobrevibacter sp. DSM 116169 TaxID=3242727 RepID=UPI0038FC63D2